MSDETKPPAVHPPSAKQGKRCPWCGVCSDLNPCYVRALELSNRKRALEKAYLAGANLDKDKYGTIEAILQLGPLGSRNAMLVVFRCTKATVPGWLLHRDRRGVQGSGEEDAREVEARAGLRGGAGVCGGGFEAGEEEGSAKPTGEGEL
jgi:hypothetical protein